MAMKLNAKEKANDSIIRAYNKQIERAYKELGYHNTVTQNLVNKARSIFGTENLKMLKQTSINSNQINKTTGEIFEIPQISRNRATLSTDNAKALQKATKYATDKSKYLSMYDVTRAYQNAVEKVMDIRRKNVPREYLQIDDIRKKTKKIKDYINGYNSSDVRRQLMINDLASEIFEAYDEDKTSTDNDDDLIYYRQFADDWHNGRDIDTEVIEKITQKRFDKLINEHLNNPFAEYNQDTILGNLNDFVDIL